MQTLNAFDIETSWKIKLANYQFLENTSLKQFADDFMSAECIRRN